MKRDKLLEKVNETGAVFIRLGKNMIFMKILVLMNIYKYHGTLT
jgi:hypothetical protein